MLDSVENQKGRAESQRSRWSDGARAASLAARQHAALTYARSLETKLMGEITRGGFDMKAKNNKIGLTAFTSFLHDEGRGFKSPTGADLTPAGVQRAFVILGKDWQYYCSLIMERRVAARRDLEAALAVDGIPVYDSISDDHMIRVENSAKERSKVWSYFISPRNYYDTFYVYGELDFRSWVEDRRAKMGVGLGLHDLERQELVERKRYYIDEKYYLSALRESHGQTLPFRAKRRSAIAADKHEKLLAWRAEQASARKAFINKLLDQIKRGDNVDQYI